MLVRKFGNCCIITRHVVGDKQGSYFPSYLAVNNKTLIKKEKLKRRTFNL